MPNSASASKRLKQSETRRLHNRSGRTVIRNHVKKVRKAIAAGDVEASETAFRAAVKKLDQGTAKNLLHANAAARVKSRLSKAIKALKGK